MKVPKTVDTLAKRIRHIRRAILDKTQKELGEDLEFDREAISRYETGKTEEPQKNFLYV